MCEFWDRSGGFDSVRPDWRYDAWSWLVSSGKTGYVEPVARFSKLTPATSSSRI